MTYTATARQTPAGTVVHEVRRDGEIVATRRSAHRYGFAYRATRDGSWHWTRSRWSRSGADVVVEVRDAEATAVDVERGCTVSSWGESCGKPSVVVGTFPDGFEWGCCEEHAGSGDYAAGRKVESR